jgi:hypothetical protein
MSGDLAKRMKRHFEYIESEDFILSKTSFKLSIDNFNSLMSPYGFYLRRTTFAKMHTN